MGEGEGEGEGEGQGQGLAGEDVRLLGMVHLQRMMWMPFRDAVEVKRILWMPFRDAVEVKRILWIPFRDAVELDGILRLHFRDVQLESVGVDRNSHSLEHSDIEYGYKNRLALHNSLG